MTCAEFEKRYWLKLYGEAVPGGEDGLQQHLQECPACRARRTEIDELFALFATRTAALPRADALANARRKLAARLRTESAAQMGSGFERFRSGFSAWLSSGWQPAAALSALLMGLFLGHLFFAPSGSHPTPAVSQPFSIENQYITEKLLQSDTRISDLRIRKIAPESGVVRVSFEGTREYVLEGTSDDDAIRTLLAWAVKHEENPGKRLQSVEGLAQASSRSASARQALAYALVHDANDGVRLKALEALSKIPRDKLTEQAILNALLQDPNPAVRIRAIDILTEDEASFRKPDALILAVAESDSNDYVRRRARQAIRQADFNVGTVAPPQQP